MSTAMALLRFASGTKCPSPVARQFDRDPSGNRPASSQNGPRLATPVENLVNFREPPPGEMAALLLPLPLAGEGRGEGPFHTLRLAEGPLSRPLHSPSKTGVNALMACGERRSPCWA